jgi:ADP-dependent NAD(P)H-hydrate dehydratase / NAD(P)H-hydrate epimerase
MRHLLTEEQSRAAEAAAVAAGATLAELMDRAGAALASEITAVCPEGRVVVMAGPGNNGGDGWTAARALHASGRDVLVLTSAEPDSMSSPAREKVRAALEAGVPWLHVDTGAEAAASLATADVIVDALLGIGLHGVPRQPYAGFIKAIGETDALVVAVDVPSGVDSDTGAALGPVVAADVTVSFSAPKIGCILQPGASLTGELLLVDIGVDPEALDLASAPESWDVADYAASLPHPRWDDRKGTRGRVLIVGGTPGLTGAVCLAAGGSLRAGAGYVSVAVPQPSMCPVEAKLTAPVKIALPASPDGALLPEATEAILEAASRSDAVVLGPGLGRAASTQQVVRELVERLEVPLLIDADALNALGSDLGPVASRVAATVLTPHSAEAALLLGTTPEEVDADRIGAVRALAVGGVTAVLKGPATLISRGGRIVVNPSGGPGLATLGTGDVLSGIIGAFLARGMVAIDAAALGTYLHGAAGDAASRDLTAVCCTADDVVAYLPEAVRGLLAADETSNRRRDLR